jgi:hypothetical protein
LALDFIGIRISQQLFTWVIMLLTFQ